MSRIRAAWWLYLEALGPGLLVGLPLGLLVGALWGHRPGGDAALWEPGGYHLLETVRLLGRDLGALTRAMPWLLLGWGVLSLVPQALALEALGPGRRAASERAATAAAALPGLGLLLGATACVRVALALLCGALSRAIEPALGSLSEQGRAGAQALVLLLGVLLLGLARVWHDLSAVAVVRWGERGRDALVTGLGALHRRFGAAVGAWAWRALVGLCGASVAALVGGRWYAGAGLWLAVVVHQVGLGALAWLRAGWLERAWELSGEASFVALGGDDPPPDEQAPSALSPEAEPSQDTPPKA